MVGARSHDHYRCIRLPPAGQHERAAMHSFDPSWHFAAIWPTAAAALAGLGLLFAFQQVVAESVAQAEQARAASAARDESLWRCKLLRKLGEREHCLTRFSTPQEK